MRITRRLLIVLASVALLTVLAPITLLVYLAFATGPAWSWGLSSTRPSKADVTQSFSAAEEDYFKEMDGGIALSPDEVKGRITWMVWTGGNDRLWNQLARSHTFGAFDLLKTLSSYPTLKFSRDNRWQVLGLSNDPCFEKRQAPIPSASDSGSTSASPNAHLTPSRTSRNIPASRSARAARAYRSVRSTAMQQASSGCACFPIRTSTRKRSATGIRSV